MLDIGRAEKENGHVCGRDRSSAVRDSANGDREQQMNGHARRRDRFLFPRVRCRASVKMSFVHTKATFIQEETSMTYAHRVDGKDKIKLKDFDPDGNGGLERAEAKNCLCRLYRN
jgi:hypothetical protein